MTLLVPRKGAALLDPSVGRLDASRPLGVYVHFPFCRVLCPYCDFAVDVNPEIPHAAYADAVLAELAGQHTWFAGPSGRLRSVYFGGGTPGLWRPDELLRVAHGAVRALAPEAGVDTLEITVEFNPGDLDFDHLQTLRKGGVNRVSLGGQSFHDGLLEGLGRTHNAAAIHASIKTARSAGVPSIACDLMYGVPGQSLDDWKRSVDDLVALRPQHISAYALSVERGTQFGALERAGRLHRPDDEAVAVMFTWAHDALTVAGFEHYEVSNYAQAGHRAIHNQLHWTGGAYMGLGAGAASFRPLEGGGGVRFTNPRSTPTYLRLRGPAKVEHLRPAQLESEALWLSLRLLVGGVDRALHAERFGADPLEVKGRRAAAERCVAAGWLAVSPERMTLTEAGALFADEVAARLWAETG